MGWRGFFNSVLDRSLHPRAVGRKLLLADQPGVHRHHHDPIAELPGDVEPVEPLAVDAQDAVVKARLVGVGGFISRNQRKSISKAIRSHRARSKWTV
jgi:hypothetical protein